MKVDPVLGFELIRQHGSAHRAEGIGTPHGYWHIVSHELSENRALRSRVRRIWMHGVR